MHLVCHLSPIGIWEEGWRDIDLLRSITSALLVKKQSNLMSLYRNQHLSILLIAHVYNVDWCAPTTLKHGIFFVTCTGILISRGEILDKIKCPKYLRTILAAKTIILDAKTLK